jgi:hypothetical protein
MRAREILQENYAESLETDLNNLLVGAKGNGSEALNTNDLVAQLTQMGYSVNVHSILTLLSRNPNVTSATPTVVNLQGPEDNQAQASTGSGQDNAAHVSSLAQKANPLS